MQRLKPPFMVLGNPGISVWMRAAGLGFLLRDDFLTDDPAPLISPRTCEPGPGMLTVIDSHNRLDISSGQILPNGAPWATMDPGIYHATGFTRTIGLALVARVKQVSAYGTDANKLISPHVAWTTVAGTSNLNLAQGAIWWSTNTLFSVVDMSASSIIINCGPACPSDTYINIAVILCSSGFIVVINNTIAWVSHNVNTSPMYPAVGSTASNRYPPGIEFIRVLQLPAPWNSDTGSMTQALPGARSAGDLFVHTADCLIEWTQTTVPSAGYTYIRFRIQDSTNYWLLVVSSAGILALYETVSGVNTYRAGTGAGMIVNGSKIKIIANGSNIRGYSDNTLRWWYSLASNFSTMVNGEINALGTAGAISDLNTLPRVLSGNTLAALNEAFS